MPLLRELQISEFDEPTRVMLAAIYLEACRQIDTDAITPALLEELRAEISARILRQANNGERNPAILKREALREIRRKAAQRTAARVVKPVKRPQAATVAKKGRAGGWDLQTAPQQGNGENTSPHPGFRLHNG